MDMRHAMAKAGETKKVKELTLHLYLTGNITRLYECRPLRQQV